MTTRRYSQFCGISCTLDVVGDRWALLVIRELWLGPRRFRQLLDGIPGITPRPLATRLEELQREGLVEEGYALTERGRSLEPVLLALARWGAPLVGAARAGGPPKLKHRIRASWLALAMRAAFDPKKAKDGRVQLELPSGSFAVAVKDRRVRFIDGLAPAPLRVMGPEPMVVGLLIRQVKREQVEHDGDWREWSRVMPAFSDMTGRSLF